MRADDIADPGLRRLAWYAELIRRCLPHARDGDECLQAVELALEACPDPEPDELLFGGDAPAAAALSVPAVPSTLYDRPGGEVLRMLDEEVRRINARLRPQLERVLSNPKARLP
jgi:hypothetical protein